MSITISEAAVCARLGEPQRQMDVMRSAVVTDGSATTGRETSVPCTRTKRKRLPKGRGRGSTSRKRKARGMTLRGDEKSHHCDSSTTFEETSLQEDPSSPLSTTDRHIPKPSHPTASSAHCGENACKVQGCVTVKKSSSISASSLLTPTEETDIAILKPPSDIAISSQTGAGPNSRSSTSQLSTSASALDSPLPNPNVDTSFETLEYGNIDMEYPMPSTPQQKMARQLARQRQLEEMRVREAAQAREERFLRRQGLLNPPKKTVNTKRIKWKDDSDLVEIFIYLPTCTSEDSFEVQPEHVPG